MMNLGRSLLGLAMRSPFLFPELPLGTGLLRRSGKMDEAVVTGTSSGSRDGASRS